MRETNTSIRANEVAKMNTALGKMKLARRAKSGDNYGEFVRQLARDVHSKVDIQALKTPRSYVLERNQ